jgi:Mlc titration factor MtfA (ptsG expression regulator)
MHQLTYLISSARSCKSSTVATSKTAYEHAKAGRKYDEVERWNGGELNTFERAYAMTNPMEYFAENIEAFFTATIFPRSRMKN